jgi:hypothetical protein
MACLPSRSLSSAAAMAVSCSAKIADDHLPNRALRRSSSLRAERSGAFRCAKPLALPHIAGHCLLGRADGPMAEYSDEEARNARQLADALLQSDEPPRRDFDEGFSIIDIQADAVEFRDDLEVLAMGTVTVTHWLGTESGACELEFPLLACPGIAAVWMRSHGIAMRRQYGLHPNGPPA